MRVVDAREIPEGRSSAKLTGNTNNLESAALPDKNATVII